MTFVRYALVQIAAYGIDMGSFLALTMGGLLGPLAANLIAKAAAGVFAFAAHRRYTFRSAADQRPSAQALRYFALLALNVPLSSGVLLVLLRWIEQPPLAKLAADILILLFTYWASKLLIFAGGDRSRRVVLPEAEP